MKSYSMEWTEFKALALKKKVYVQKVETPNALEVFFSDSDVIFRTIIWKSGEPGFSQEILDDWLATFDSRSNSRTSPLVDNGKLLSVSEPRSGTEVIISTHNMCDKCTWYGDSVRVTDETLTRQILDPAGQYTSANAFWIDMVSGRVQDDENVTYEHMASNPGNPHGYLVNVKVNGVTRPMREPLETTGGDYTVDWEEGKIQFVGNLPSGGDVVTASYSYATTSTFYLRPFPEAVLNIEAAEADFSTDVEMSDGIEYGVWGFVEVYAPQYAFTPSSSPFTFTNGSTTVTGTGFNDLALPGKYIRRISDPPEAVMIVASVESDTSLTLAYPYSGTTGSEISVIASTSTGVYPVGTKIPLKSMKYKRMLNILQEGIGAYPVIISVGSSTAEKALSIVPFRNTSRGVRKDFQAIPFRYATTRSLVSTYGLEVRIRTLHDRCFGGEAAYLTFYGTTENAP